MTNSSISNSILYRNTMDFWTRLRALVPVDVPQYVRELLTATGFDNYLSLESLDDAAMKEISEFSKEKKSPLLIGHKVMLFRIRDIIRSKGMEELSKFDKDLERQNTAVKLKPPPNQRANRNSGVGDLNSEEMVLRNKIKELFKRTCLNYKF